MEFITELAKYQELINLELCKYLREEDTLEGYLNNSFEYSLMAGGKRLRPILMLGTYKLFSNNIEEAFPFAVAMEMIHNFSLIHDDLPAIDNGDLRHGKLTNHKKFNEATAILAGDLLLNNAYLVISKELLKDENSNKRKAFYELTSGADKMIIGEYVDTEFEGKNISEEELKYIHNNKTAALLTASVRIGAILGEANEEELEKITRYGENIGLAFQIKDDILGEIGNQEIFGKPVGLDKEEKKCTFVSKYGLEKSKELLEELIAQAIENIKEFKNSDFLQSLAYYIKDREK